MPEQETDFYYSGLNTKLRDTEEKIKLLKERVLLIGQNLVEIKETLNSETALLKTEMEILKQENNKIKNAIARVIEEMQNLTRKEETAMLERQFKMFQPLKLARIEDVERMIKENMKKEKQKKQRK